jgi:hypothetical protein
MGGRSRRAATITVTLAVLCFAAPSAAVDSTDVTGDVTPPRLESLTMTPLHADVTNAPATFSLTARVTDDLSGVEGNISVDWGTSTSGYGVHLTRVSGDARDGTYSGSFQVPRYFQPGTFPIDLTFRDRVGNSTAPRSADLQARGFPHAFEVTDANPDGTAPRPTHVALSTSVVDVTAGSATIKVDVSAADDQSGVKWVTIWLLAPNYSGGGATTPIAVRVSGTAAAGTWSGTATVPRYARQGRWRLSIYLSDELNNNAALNPDQLAGMGLVSSFDVVSDEDAVAPQLEQYSMTPIEVNVHDQDQPVRVRLRITDDKAGVATVPWESDAGPYTQVQFAVEDPVTQQANSTGYMRRTSGTAVDGIYEATITIPKSSATGLRPAGMSATDAVGNWKNYGGLDLVRAGGVPALLVYNVPLPPLPIGADPLDGGAIVRWDPPTDDRGAEVTEYVIRESPQGLVSRVDGDARAVTMSGLTNGVQHTFRIEAVNKAGPSDPSAAVAATPAVDAVAPSSPAPGSSGRSGYWMVGRSGSVYAFGDARWFGNAPVGSAAAVDIEPAPGRDGYWVVDETGRVFPFGSAAWRGNAGALAPGELVTSMSATRSGAGYWLFTTRGRVLPFGDAPFLGDMSRATLNGPVLDSVPSPSGNGYYMVASDGGVFSFGDARFAGSMGGARLNAPVQSLVPDADGFGYWLVASDGGIFAFGAAFHGSMGSSRLNRPVTGMVGSSTGRGYLMVAEDGGIFAFGDVPFRGSLGANPPSVPVVAVAAA